MKTLWIVSNPIEELPESVGELINLETLILNQNNIRFLPNSISKLTNLKQLKMSYNKLENCLKILAI
jgi:leucine-rich repeat protein SHOC2